MSEKKKTEIQEARAIVAISGTHSLSGYVCFVFPNSKMREEGKEKKKAEHQSRSLQSVL